MYKKSIINFALLLLFFFTGSETLHAAWKYYYKKGMIEYNARLYDYAEENLKKALRLNGKLYQAAAILGDIYMKRNKTNKAFDYYERSLKISDNQPETHFKVGAIYEFYYEMESAARHYRRAAELDPGHSMAHLKLVNYYLDRGDRTKADFHFNACYSVGKDKGNELFQKALDAEENRKDKKAESLYRETIEANPAHLDAYIRLSQLYRRRKESRKAVKCLEELLKARSDYYKAHVQLGELYFSERLSKNRKYYIEKAIASLNRAAALEPKNPEPYILLTDIYRFIGNREMEKQMLQKSLQLEGKSP